ncbi:hypothetical protein M8C21_018791 [Ambrosia artemisiifolia]|uniref:Uncharacterized protein n=1 Tax=Ambrosia artemisiifolia TaxID=4212 RepID=A0AAD5D861_AMBAR|nr:hypothetical protein M8C21_018791 [Ambrosia artemisiifolia]
MLKTTIYIFVYIFGVIALVWRVVIRCKQNMKGTVRYLAGIAGQSGYGSKTTAEQVTQDCNSLPPHLTAIVTGATSGIGAETARVLAKRGVRIVIPARDLRKAGQVKETIQKETPNAEIIILEIDLSSFASIRKFCSEFLSLDIPLNILIYNATRAYAQSKLANIMHANQLAKQLKAMNANVTINAVHPGIVKTGIIRDHKGVITGMHVSITIYSIFFIASKFLKSTSQGASTTCYVALSQKTEGVSGRYFADCNEIRSSSLANDDSEAHKLWKHTRALIHKRLRVQLRP